MIPTSGSQVLASTRWADLDPKKSVFEELGTVAGIRSRVRGLDAVVADCRLKATDFKYGPALPAGLTEDGLGALVAYTHDNQTGKRAGNLYFELNSMLRERGMEQRAETMKVWGGFMYFFMGALDTLPAYEGVVYRGYPDKQEVVEQYKMGRPIQWGAFSSTTTDTKSARHFTDKTTGVIFKISVLTGRSVNAYSFFPAEGEILLTPNHRFTVTSKPYELEGYTVVDMCEMQGDAFVS